MSIPPQGLSFSQDMVIIDVLLLSTSRYITVLCSWIRPMPRGTRAFCSPRSTWPQVILGILYVCSWTEKMQVFNRHRWWRWMLLTIFFTSDHQSGRVQFVIVCKWQMVGPGLMIISIQSTTAHSVVRHKHGWPFHQIFKAIRWSTKASK